MLLSALKRYAIFGASAALIVWGVAPKLRHTLSSGILFTREGSKLASEMHPIVFAFLLLGSTTLHPWFLLLAHLSEPEGRL